MFSPNPLGCRFLGAAADFADHDDTASVSGSSFEQVSSTIEMKFVPMHRVPSDADTGGLADDRATVSWMHRLVGERTRYARSTPTRPGLVDVPRHDADLCLAPA